MQILIQLLKSFIVIIVSLICVAYITLLERKIIGYIQLRKGPNKTGIFGMLQPIADGIKFISKEIIVPEKSQKFLFLLSPLILFISSVLSWSLIPFFEDSFANLTLGALYPIAIASIGIFSIAVAGIASGSKYAILGAIRAIAQMISYEIVIGLIVIAIGFTANSFNLSQIVLFQKNIWIIFYLFPLGIIFFIASLAKTNRMPFDFPESESELVSGYNVEYSGILYALFYISEYLNIIFASIMLSILFFGGWSAPFGFIKDNILWLFVKSFIFIFLFIVIRATLPRIKYNSLIKLCWKYFIPICIICIFLISTIKFLKT